MAIGNLEYQGFGGNDGAWGALYPNPAVLDGGADSKEIDYSQGWPIERKKPRKTGTEAMDDDLKAFQETHPVQITPPPMQRQAPVGMLGMDPTGTMPPGVGGNPVPPQMAPPLPPPINVAAAPQPMDAGAVPAPGAPPAVAGAAPVSAPGSTDISAQSRGTPPGAAPMPADGGGPGLLQRFDQWTQRNPSTLLALAAGFAGAPSFGTGMSRGFGNAVTGVAADQKVNLQQSQIASTYRALLKAGVPPHIALAATQNPEILKKITDEYLVDGKNEIKTIKSKDMFGGESERLVSVNPRTNAIKELQPGAAGSGAPGSGTINNAFAKGITQDNFDHTKTGDDYLAQYSPEVQAGVHKYLRGESLPTGRQGSAQAIKFAAQKYGEDMGIPSGEASYQQRKEWGTSVANTKSGVGFQAKGFQQGLQHMQQLSDKLVKLGNWNGLGSEDIAGAANYVRNRTTGQTDIKNGVSTDAALLAGETGKLFSGNSGGGVHERAEMAGRFGNPNMSGPAAAGALESALEAMEGGLKPLEGRRDQLFPKGGAPAGSEFITDNERKAMATIRKNIEILRGNAQAAPATNSPVVQSKASTGVQWKVITP